MTTTITSGRVAAQRVQRVQSDLLANLAYLASFTKDGLGGMARAHMRRWVCLDVAGLVCVLCGDLASMDVSPRSPRFAHLGHLISAEYIARECGYDIADGQGNKGGYLIGNMACQHKGCNLDAGTSVIKATDLARPDLVPLDTSVRFHKHGMTQG